MNMQAMMAQAQKMQKELEKKISEFSAKAFEYSYKNDSIVVIIKGDLTILDIKINDVLVDPEDKQTLQEMICEAVNAAVSGVNQDREAIQNSVSSKGGMPF
ncbi:MAG: YbaB/EbfC family nucleoid-associated protein [Mycoplasmataceae bacterium]|jgi:DNA-binding YbaB/EbfC family protein|nr:YbaB/EbfC family nucleoid-associated protein [Mycoplasmataceae bacterium]